MKVTGMIWGCEEAEVIGRVWVFGRTLKCLGPCSGHWDLHIGI